MADNNRIGSACWYRPAVVGPWRGGTLRMWGTDSDECDGNYGLFPVGVIEDDEHRTCHAVHVSRICFAAVHPT